jgi:hypothetical protein
MTYLTGKRFEYIGEENTAGTKTGVIVSEPFRQRIKSGVGDSSVETCVAVLWDDGSMEGAIDVELLKVIEEEDTGYVVVANDDNYETEAKKAFFHKGSIILETYLNQSTQQEARRRINALKGRFGKCRVAKLHFIE